MITRLHISNYALIDSLDIDFTSGLNIITGETGAGKSIMLGALSLLLGARADGKAIRTADRKSVVEASFNVSDRNNLAEWAVANEVEWDSNECILRRELSAGGRSRAFINDSPVTLSLLSELGSQLIDIHSQHQNQLLASTDYQRRILDSVAGNGALLEEYKILYIQWRLAEKNLDDARREIERARENEEYNRFRLAQLDDADLIAGEQEDLEEERELQANMTQIKQTLSDALEPLTNAEENVLALLSDAVNAVDELGEVLEDAAALARRLESAKIEIQDVAETLADYDANLGADPQALERIEERLSQLYSLESRFHAESVESLIEIRDNLRKSVAELEDGDVVLSDLQTAANSALTALKTVAAKLTARRTDAAKRFASELLAVASPLGMPNLRCDIAVEPCEITPSGADKVEFRFAFNKNQKAVPVGGAASGGEVSRLMLSIKAIVAGRLQLPSIVFDEVDTGVSGDVANRMGEMMLDISSNLQVITITHLPQVAAKGVSHFKVFKEDDTDATHTRIRRLSESEREHELAMMLSGSSTDEAALTNARALLKRK